MQSNTLYVGNLNYAVKEDELEELFAQFGKVESVRIIGRKGFGFVEFGETDEAESAKEKLDGTEFRGRQLRINEAKPKPEGGSRMQRSY